MKKQKLLATLLTLALSASMLCVPSSAVPLELPLAAELGELSQGGRDTTTAQETADDENASLSGWTDSGSYDENGQFWPSNYDAAKQAEADATGSANGHKITFTSGFRNAAESTGTWEWGGNTANWTLKDGILTISGTGTIFGNRRSPKEGNDSLYASPFEGNRYVETILVEKGIKLVSAFAHMPNLKTILLMDNESYSSALALNCDNIQTVILGANLQDSSLPVTGNLEYGGTYFNRDASGSANKTLDNLVILSSAYSGDLSAQIAKAKAIISGLNLPDSVLSKLPSNIGGTGDAVTVNTAVNLPSDIAYSSWAESYIQQAYELGLMNVNSIGTTYTENITRGEFCVLADNLYKKLTGDTANRSPNATFTDLTDCTDAQLRAIHNMNALNVISGYGGGLFGPEDSLTREQAAVILTKLAEAVGKPLTSSATPFTDTTTSWSADGISKCYGSVIMTGLSETSFGPQNTYTIEQGIVTMVKLYEYVSK
jgi:hypothetical protein